MPDAEMKQLADPNCICQGTGLVTRLISGLNTGPELCTCVCRTAARQERQRIREALEKLRPGFTRREMLNTLEDSAAYSSILDTIGEAQAEREQTEAALAKARKEGREEVRKALLIAAAKHKDRTRLRVFIADSLTKEGDSNGG